MKNLFIAFITALCILMFIFMMELAVISQDLKKQVDYYKELYGNKVNIVGDENNGQRIL